MIFIFDDMQVKGNIYVIAHASLVQVVHARHRQDHHTGFNLANRVEWGYPGLWIPNHGIINTTPTTYDLAIKLFEYQCLKYIKVLAHLTPWNLKDTQKNP